MEFGLAVIVLVGVVAMVVLLPLMREGGRERSEDHRRAALEAAKEAKYREIRDAELDYRMGKLSADDYQRTDGELRAQAIAILKDIDRLDDR